MIDSKDLYLISQDARTVEARDRDVGDTPHLGTEEGNIGIEGNGDQIGSSRPRRLLSKNLGAEDRLFDCEHLLSLRLLQDSR